MLKLGFSKYEFNTYLEYSNNGIHIICDKKSLAYRYSPDGVELVGQELKYVHQLQNLYFALTNKELEINELIQKETKDIK